MEHITKELAAALLPKRRADGHKGTFGKVCVIGGSVAYYLVYTFAIWLEVDTDLLKMMSAVIVAIFLAIPYLKSEYFTKPKPPAELVHERGGEKDA